MVRRWPEDGRCKEALAVLADHAPVMFSYVDADERYRYVSRRYGEYFGRRPETIVGMSVAELLGPGPYAAARPHLQRALAGAEVTYERDFQLPEGAYALHVRYVPDTDAAGRVAGVFAIIRDLTQQKESERALQRSRDRLHVIMETAPAAIVTADEAGVIRDFNRAAEQTFGYARDEAVGRPVAMLMPPPYRTDHDRYMGRYRKTRRSRILGRPVEAMGQRKDGTTFPLEVTMAEMDPAGLFVGLIQDVSERRRLEREVAEASAYEQERIGREIHDGISQQLTAVSMLVESARKLLGRRQAGEVELLDQVAALLKEVMAEARSLARGLVPVPRVADGLPAALQALAAEVTATMGVRCELTLDGIEEVANEDGMLVTQLYRIAQEAVHNGARHARASHIRIQLTGPADHPGLTVTDDGKGLETEDRGPAARGLGLRIMAHRAAVIGYRLSIESAPGEGTTLRARRVLPQDTVEDG